MTTDDMRLVREYAAHQSESAFATIASRHTNLVYSAALRQTRDPQQAEEVTQAVFILLARKAASLGAKTILTGWLYRTTGYVSGSALKRERRRQHHEQEAYMQSELNAQADPTWSQLSPLLDEAMLRLGQTDRDALVLRYFEGRSLQEVGSALGASEEAAKKRVSRALEKLRNIFAKRGVNSTTAAIGKTISAHSIQAAPVALAKTVTAVALAKGATASISTLTLIKGALKIMAWTKMKTSIVAGVAVLIAVGTTTVAFKVIEERPMVVQGKTESEWIKSIVYMGDDKQTKLWHSLGPRGIKMLLRAMKPSRDILTYEQALAGHGIIDNETLLKKAVADRGTQMNAAFLLGQLADKYDVKSAIPDVIKLLKIEKDHSVRAIELGFFEIPIQSMSEKEKAALFPELLLSLNGDGSDERNNALVALQNYADQKETVIPLMVKALQDSSPLVRMRAVKALNQIDPRNTASTNFVPVLVGCLNGLPDSTAVNESVIMLGELHRDPDLTVPALIKALESDKSWVRNNAAAALGRFGGQAKTAVPALQNALQDSDPAVKRQAEAALKRINSEVSTK